MQEFKDGGLISNEAARMPSSRDQVAITIRVRDRKESAVEELLSKERDQLCSAAQDQFAVH